MIHRFGGCILGPQSLQKIAVSLLNFSTTTVTDSPNRPSLDMGASNRKVLSLSLMSVRVSQRWHSTDTILTFMDRPTARAVCLVALSAKSVACLSSLTASRQAFSLVQLFKQLCLIDLKYSHRMKRSCCLPSGYVGFTNQSESNSTRFGWQHGPQFPSRRRKQCEMILP